MELEEGGEEEFEAEEESEGIIVEREDEDAIGGRALYPRALREEEEEIPDEIEEDTEGGKLAV